MKKILSIFLSTVMIISSSISVFASQTQQVDLTKNDRVTIGEYQYEVIQNGSEIIVNEYDADTLISRTTSTIESDIMTKENYNNARNVSKEYANKSDFVLVADLDAIETLEGIQDSRAASWITYGRYNLQLKNYTGATMSHSALLTYYIDYTDDESFRINGNKGDTVSFVVSAVASIIAGIVTGGASLAAQLVAAVMVSAGSFAVNGIIQQAFTENVSAIVKHTKTKYTDMYGGGTGSIFKGKQIQVKTRDSKYYNEMFYEGDAPQRYSSNANKACLNTYVGSYVSSNMLSFTLY